jgi:tripartite-type tricarboxylate transporter receptor subunit TctC
VKAEYVPMSSTPEKFAEFLKSEVVRWAKVIKDANIKTVN